jgi:hypothetical protein
MNLAPTLRLNLVPTLSRGNVPPTLCVASPSSDKAPTGTRGAEEP